MPDPHQHNPLFTPGTPEESSQQAATYRIMRRGSYYNILGPHGRVFSKYKSASVVGSRWEELTKTPWPYRSSAFESGQRLWELGLIPRSDIGKTRLALPPDQPAAKRTRTPVIAPRKVRATRTVKVLVLIPPTTMALPAPRIDLDLQRQLMTALRRDPALIFHPPVQNALRNEVEYNLPQARWAQHLLDLLARFHRRQRIRERLATQQKHSQSIMTKHIAWQEQRHAAPQRQIAPLPGVGMPLMSRV